MTVKAKPILKDRFWIVEDETKKIGTLSWNEDRYMFSDGNETCFFDNKKQVSTKFPHIEWGKHINKTISDTKKEVHGYPTSVTPYNTMFDVKRKLPLFTKSKKSKSLYCAGYYIVCFEKGWVKSFCPKLITIERYESRGPYKTEFEMKQELSRANQ